jgi:hypothetical protein
LIEDALHLAVVDFASSGAHTAATRRTRVTHATEDVAPDVTDGHLCRCHFP